jgi:hypothetical protein
MARSLAGYLGVALRALGGRFGLGYGAALRADELQPAGRVAWPVFAGHTNRRRVTIPWPVAASGRAARRPPRQSAGRA